MTSVAGRLTDLVVRIKRRRKLLAIALAVLMPVFVLSGVVIHESMDDIAFAEKELAGTAYLRRTWNLLSVCDAGITPSHEAFGRPLHGQVLPRLEAEASAMIAELGHDAMPCEKARRFMRHVADETNLMLDPRPDSYYLMHAAVVDIPALSGHAAARITPTHTLQSRIDRVSETAQAVDDSLQRAMRTSDASLASAVTLPAQTLSRAVNGMVGDASGHAVASNEMRGALDTLWVVSVNQLERLLNLRITTARLTLGATLALAFLLSAAAVAGLVYYDLYVEREEVMKLNAVLQQSNEELERFAYICSHDLQEPVRMVNIYVGMLLEDSRDQLDEVGRRHLDYIAANARAMKQMIQDILACCRIGRDPLTLTEVDCDTVLQQVLDRLSPAIADASATISITPLPTVMATHGVMHIILQNLIGNAIKFRSAGAQPEVRVSAYPDGDVWRFEVADNGIGIDDAYREDVFTVFRRLHRRDDYPGHGLGLSTCRKLLHLLGGDIDFTSTPGRGTTFIFTIPQAG